MAEKYDFKEVERTVSAQWLAKDTYKTLKERNKGGKRFYFLQGPPYTNGKIHLGTAWNNVLKDMVLRYHRMQGLDVWDRAGWDNHGLPTEWAIMRKFSLKDDHDVQAFGVDRFIKECEQFCLENTTEMTKTLQSLGVWMDFDDPYMTLSKEWINSVWWFVKKAHDSGRLYEGLRTMCWDVPAATAVAKHELEYREVEDTAIFVKFALRKKKDEFLIIWTTTPWTIPYNLAVMVHPDLTYDKVAITNKGRKEYWWVCHDLVESFMGMIAETFSVVETCKGQDLEGVEYVHPFEKDMGFALMKTKHPNLHTVLLSREYVDTSVGSGLVHCAPGCGPEDFEVGHRNGLPPFNSVDENGVLQSAGRFSDHCAKKDDALFIDMMEQEGCLIHQHPFIHEYPFDMRSKQPVIFRTTKQWFLKVEDLKDEFIKENAQIDWKPKAAFNAFNSWLENLRDNSISKQRYWGTPLPIWRNTSNPEDYLVIGSSDELKGLIGKELDDLHTPTLDRIKLQKDGKTYVRVPDVVDVWIDAGVGSYACLKYPLSEDDFTELFPADFIMEGKDQIRGWFNLLHVISMVAFGRKAFKACYMHGFVLDSQGRKMSKSEGNYIVPKEVTDKYGSDVFRYYFIGSAQPGLDANYNPEDVEQRSRTLSVLWNLHHYLADLKGVNGFSQHDMLAGKEFYSLEEKYLRSRLHSTIRDVTQALNEYQLNIVPGLVESFFLDMSRTYVQLVREKTSGSVQERLAVYSALSESMLQTLKMMSVITPFVAEKMFQDLFGQESVHLCGWPKVDETLIDADLEKSMRLAQTVITAGLSAREKARIGLRWPLSSVTLEMEKSQMLVPVIDLLKSQLNVKKVVFGKVPVKYEAKPNYKAIGNVFGLQTADVLVMLKENMAKVVVYLEKDVVTFTIGGFELTKELFDVCVLPLEGVAGVLFDAGKLMIDTAMTPDLEAEGYLRELTRRVQQLRKEAGLSKSDRITLEISGPTKDLDLAALGERVGAVSVVEGGQSEVKIKDRSFLLSIR